MILIPAAGEGKRFAAAGYGGPKHLIPIAGVPMIERVIENCLKILPGHEVVVADQKLVGKTRGATDTILTALARLGPINGPLLIANCDQLIEADPCELDHDGIIFTFLSANPAHSYVQTEFGLVTYIVEKDVISDRAVAGVYVFEDPEWVVDACAEVLKDPQGESYFSAAISQMLKEGALIEAVSAPTAILGTPEDFQRFEVALSLAC